MVDGLARTKTQSYKEELAAWGRAEAQWGAEKSGSFLTGFTE